jgi:periplasmic protein TonB
MATQPPREFDAFEERSAVRAALPYVVGLVLVGVLAWLVYVQLTAVRGIRVENDPKAMVDVSPLPPPPPPPPPPPEPKEKPPEPTEQPQPSPAEAVKAPQQPAAAPVSMAASAEAGSDSYGVAAGSGTGIGAPSSGGTCLGTKCGAGGGGGGGMGLKLYDRYLSDALQTRVDRDDRANRQVFSADFLIWVSPRGKITAVRTVRSTGSDGRDKLLAGILDGIDGLTVPPGDMSFPRKITVRGRRPM